MWSPANCRSGCKKRGKGEDAARPRPAGGVHLAVAVPEGCQQQGDKPSVLSKICTHALNSPKDYEWLRDHFVAVRHLLSDKTYSLYLDSYKKDKIGVASMYDPTPKPAPIPANYMALQEEAKQMCEKLKEMLGQQDE